MAEQGQVQKLSWIQRKFAFGFSTDLDADCEGVSLYMTVDRGRPIDVKRYGWEYYAVMEIDGKLSKLEKIYVHASAKRRGNLPENHSLTEVKGPLNHSMFNKQLLLKSFRTTSATRYY